MKYFIKKSKVEMIEPEEILLDKMSADKLDDSKIEVPIKNNVFWWFFGFILIIFLVFFVRSVQLQIFNYERYATMAENNKTRSYPILAKRGVIYDRNMNQLVYNVPSFDLVAVPANLPRSKTKREQELIKVAEKLNLDKQEFLNKFEKIGYSSFLPVLIQENIKREDALFIESKIDEFEGIELKKNSVRNYKDGIYFAHILGYVGKVSDKDISQNKNFSSLDYIGKAGIELYYDKFLRGENGRMIQNIDSTLRLKEEKKIKNEKTGNNLVLSIDYDLQKYVYEELKKEVDEIKTARGAAAIALNPKTGEVLAMVSLPSYNNNIFSSSELRKEYISLLKDPLEPFFNRVIAGMYSPGSAIKPFIASAALEEGVITENTKINDDKGYISIPNQYNPDIVYTFRDWKIGGHGITDVRKAIMVSSNVFFYIIGGGYEDIKGLGIEKIKKYLNMFGFGKETGIDLNGEKIGLIPDKKWKEEFKGEGWYIGDTYISSIGQGNVLVTPLQLALATAVIANNGTLYQPYILKEVIDQNQKTVFKNKPKVIRDNFIDNKNLQVVREGMRMAVTDGSARRLSKLSVDIAGKTGTAQTGDGETHAWFTSFAPYDDPEIALVILIERGGEGSGAAVPVAGEIYKRYFENKDDN